MNVELHTEQGVKIIVPLVRRLDASVVQAFKQQVLEAIDPDTKNVLLDLNHVDFIDSSCLGALVSHSEKRQRSGRVGAVFAQ
ncbi:anti-sigma F factor antagonist (spoIIAA-2) [Klebsiella pneumoniae]|nr:anti-sigma F factor antagonist (spoIIAA-2) [Klebsiella pneumoniae]